MTDRPRRNRNALRVPTAEPLPPTGDSAVDAAMAHYAEMKAAAAEAMSKRKALRNAEDAAVVATDSDAADAIAAGKAAPKVTAHDRWRAEFTAADDHAHAAVLACVRAFDAAAVAVAESPTAEDTAAEALAALVDRLAEAVAGLREVTDEVGVAGDAVSALRSWPQGIGRRGRSIAPPVSKSSGTVTLSDALDAIVEWGRGLQVPNLPEQVPLDVASTWAKERAEDLRAAVADGKLAGTIGPPDKLTRRRVVMIDRDALVERRRQRRGALRQRLR